MKRNLLLTYQLATGLSDGVTGLLLMVAPVMTLRLMGIHQVPSPTVFLSLIGAFVFSVGVGCLYGAALVLRGSMATLRTVWLLTSITRATVAIFVALQIAAGAMESRWLTVAASDGCIALVQITCLMKGWVCDDRHR